jgi:sugar phosphate isomerase/epimerase
MRESLTRREFLEGSGRMLSGLTAASLLLGRSAAGEDKPPLCLSCRDVHLKQTGDKDCWSAMRAIGAEGVEATIGDDLAFADLFHPDRKYTAATLDGLEALVTDMKSSGRRISAFCIHSRFDQRADFEIDKGAKAARAAKALGVKAIRIDVASRKIPAAEFLEPAAASLKKLIEQTEGTGVTFGIENHGALTNDPKFLVPLLDRVGSKRLGVTLDTGNLYWFGHPLSKVYEIYEALAPRVCHTHCKSIKYPQEEREKQRLMGWEYKQYSCPIDEGDIDFRRVLKILRGAGYTGDLCIEDESLGKFPAEERGKVLAREIRYLKEIQSA